jgi:hypothetical protein
MMFISNDHTIRKFSNDGSSESRPPPTNRPGHCGEDMQLSIHSTAAAGDSQSPIPEQPGPDLRLVWQCRCGFRLDPQPDHREEVWAAAAAVETCQWEMDHAVQELHRALREASAKGATDELLAESAQLPLAELQMILGQTRE